MLVFILVLVLFCSFYFFFTYFYYITSSLLQVFNYIISFTLFTFLTFPHFSALGYFESIQPLPPFITASPSGWSSRSSLQAFFPAKNLYAHHQPGRSRPHDKSLINQRPCKRNIAWRQKIHPTSVMKQRCLRALLQGREEGQEKGIVTATSP